MVNVQHFAISVLLRADGIASDHREAANEYRRMIAYANALGMTGDNNYDVDIWEGCLSYHEPLAKHYAALTRRIRRYLNDWLPEFQQCD